MRVLVATTPGTGHVNPVLPLADALRDAGHGVEWATAADAAPRLEARGFRTHVAGLDLAERGRRVDERLAVAPPPPGRRRPVAFRTVFADVAAPVMATDLAPVLDAVRPDLVLHEPAELAVAPLAAARGVPHVCVAFGLPLDPEMVEALDEAVGARWAAAGAIPTTTFGMFDHRYLHQFPPSLGAPPDLPTVRLLRPDAPTTDGSPPPAWCATLGRDRPFVYVTFGTEFSDRAPWRAVLDALGGLDVDVVCTTGPPVDPATLGAPPANTRVERFVPQHHLLPRAALLVTHAGSGAVLGAAAAGVPILALPLAADQPDNGAAIEAAGVGRALDPASATADAIRDDAASLLADAAAQDRARTLSAEVAAMPVPATVATDLVTLVDPERAPD